MAEVQGEILRAEMFTEAIGRLSAAVASWSKVHVILRGATEDMEEARVDTSL